jgi:hypothetical protein
MARALKGGLGLEIGQSDRDFIIGRSWVDIYDHLCRAHGRLAWGPEFIAATAAERVHVFAELGSTPGGRAGGGPSPAPVPARRRHRFVPGRGRTGAGRARPDRRLRGGRGQRGRGAFEVGSGRLSRRRSRARLDPSACLVVEDSHAGIAAGLAAGAMVVAVEAGNFAGHDQSSAHHVLATLDQLTVDFVRRL